MSSKQNEDLSDRQLHEQICGRGRIPSAASGSDKNEFAKRTIPAAARGVDSAFWEYVDPKSESGARIWSDRDSVVQEAAIRIWQNVCQWNGRGSLAGWAFTIGLNTARNYLQAWNTRLLTTARCIDEPLESNDGETGLSFEETIPNTDSSSAQIQMEAVEMIDRLSGFIRKVRNPLVGHLVSGFARGVYKSITAAAASLSLYPRDLRKVLEPYKKQLHSILSYDADVRREILRLEKAAKATGKTLFPDRRYDARRMQKQTRKAGPIKSRSG